MLLEVEGFKVGKDHNRRSININRVQKLRDKKITLRTTHQIGVRASSVVKFWQVHVVVEYVIDVGGQVWQAGRSTAARNVKHQSRLRSLM
jgi:hypothetical protein